MDSFRRRIRQFLRIGLEPLTTVDSRWQFNAPSDFAMTTNFLSQNQGLIRQTEDEFIDTMLDTTPCDRQKAEWTVSQIYQAIGLRPPLSFFWFESPLGSSLAVSLFAWFSFDQFDVVAGEDARSRFVEREEYLLLPRLQSWERRLDAVAQNESTIKRELAVSQPSESSDDLPMMHEIVRFSHLNRLSACTNITEAISRTVHHDLLQMLRQKNPLDVWLDVWSHIAASIESNSSFHTAWTQAGELIWLLDDAEHRRILERLVNQVTGGTSQSLAWYGQHDVDWIASFECMRKLGVEMPSHFDLLKQSVRQCGWWWPLTDVCIMSDRPAALHADSSFLLHCQNEPAVRFSDDWGFFCLRGITVPERLARGEFAPGEIDRQDNVELRRVMIDRYGATNYLRDTGAKPIQQDSFGVLYRKVILGDEPIVMVEVKNATPEKDGSYKTYFLRVPPQIRSAEEAVAWTFGMEKGKYKPKRES